MDHANQIPPCHAQPGATLGQDLAVGDSETSQLGPSEHFEHACHISSGNRPTPLEGWGGHWEAIFFCLRLSKRGPWGQLSSSSDSEAKAERPGPVQPAGEVRCLARGVLLPQLCPQASRSPYSGALN